MISPESNPLALGFPREKIGHWIAELEASAHRAEQSQSCEQWVLSLAGTRVLVRSSGPAITTWIRPALAYAMQRVDPGGPLTASDMELAIWDQASTGVAPPRPFWNESGWANRGELPALAEGGVIAAYNEHAGYLAVFDTLRRRAWIWVRNAQKMPRYEYAAPLRGPLSWMLSMSGRQLAHAAAVATEDGAALLVGAGGTGKSTTSMACLVGGLHYLGDDYVLVHQDGDERPCVHTLYATAKLAERSFELLPALTSLADAPATSDEKAVLQLADVALGTRILRTSPIVGIILPRIAKAQDISWERTSQARALTALAPTTLFQLPGAGRDSLLRLAVLARSVPAFTLHLGQKMDAIAPAVRAIINMAAAEKVTEGVRAT